MAREIIAGRNWRNLPVLGALALLLVGNLLVHLGALGIADAAPFGNRLGLVTLLLLISLVGGRIIPSFTRNWLSKMRPAVPPPVPATAASRRTCRPADLEARRLPWRSTGLRHSLRRCLW